MCSVLSDISDHWVDSAAVLSRVIVICESQSVRSQSLQTDVSSSVTNLISTLVNKKAMNRTMIYRLLVSILDYAHLFPGVESRIASIVEKVPYMIESLASNDVNTDEMKSFLCLLEVILNSKSDIIVTETTKVFLKIAASASRMCDKEITIEIGFSVLSILVSSPLGLMLQPSMNMIWKACLNGVCHPLHYVTASELLARIISSGNADIWMSLWNAILVECIRLMLLLGIPLNVDRSAIRTRVSMLPTDVQISRLHGVRKALLIERSFRGCTKLIQEVS